MKFVPIYREERHADGRRGGGIARCIGCRARIVYEQGQLHRMLFLHFLGNRRCVRAAAELGAVQQAFDEDGCLWPVLRSTITVLGSEPPYSIEAIADDAERVVLWQIHQTWGTMISGPDGTAANVAASLRQWGHAEQERGTPYRPFKRYIKPPEHVPEPDEIRSRCEALQDSWSELERARKIADGPTRTIALQQLGILPTDPIT